MAFSTKRPLNDSKYIQESGQTLTLSGDTFFGYAEYLTDNSAEYVARSVPDVGYVTGLTSQGIVTANNGLTKEGQNVRLGGTLTGDTKITTSNFGVAFGGSASATNNSIAVGTSSALGYHSFAAGSDNSACGDASHAEGSFTQSIGDFSHTGGYGYFIPDRYLKACGLGSFNHSRNTFTQTAGHGANADFSAILGGQNHNIESGNVRAAIIGGDAIKLTGTSYIDHTAVDNLAIFSAPSTGDVNSDNLLVWDSVDKKVKQLSPSTVGGITGATNGLSVNSEKNVVLGGSLTGNTLINSNGSGIAFGQSVSATNGSFAIGLFGCAVGIRSFSQGETALAFGTNSHAQGSCVRACGANSHAQGYYARSIGSNSHAAGSGYFAGPGSRYIESCGDASFNHSTNNASQTQGYGANASSSAILGGRNHNIESGNTRAAIVGGDGINLTGTNYIDYTAVDNLAIWSAPSTGDVDADNVLLWDATDKKVKQASVSAVGGITGASNGLSVSSKEVILGGSLTQNTTISGGGSYSLNLGDSLSLLSELNACTNCINLQAPNTNATLRIDSSNTVLGGYNSKCIDITTSNMFICDASNNKGLEYDADYSSNFTARSLVDKGYVDGEIDKTITGASNGLTKVDQNATLGGTLTGDTCVDTATFGLALGNGSVATGEDSVAVAGGGAYGDNTWATLGGKAYGNDSWAIANGVASGASSGALASGVAIGTGSLAIGFGAIACGNSTFVLGGASTADGFGSQAFGYCVCTTAQGAFALGNRTQAIGNYSFAFGKGVDTKPVSASGVSSINFSTNTTAQIAGHGADADFSVIFGGINHHIDENNTGAVIIGRYGTTGIILSGTTNNYEDHVVVPNLAIWSEPVTGGDMILTWDSADNKVKMNTIGDLGGLSGTTNGLQTIDNEAGLGGTLTETNTNILGATNNLSIGTSGSRVGNRNDYSTNHIIDASTLACIRTTTTGGDLVIDAQNQGEIVIKSQNGSVGGDTFTAAVGFNLDYLGNTFSIVDNRAGSNQTGIQYLSDYSSNYVDRSLVDKAYVDSVAAGLDAKDAVDVATTISDGDIDLTGGTFVSGSTIDGTVVQDGWRVLIKNQADAVENGIYVYSASTSGFTRAGDFDGTPAGEVSNGAYTLAITGDTNANSQWVVTTPDPITVGTTEINWSLLSQQLDITAGSGITINTIASTRQVSVKVDPNCALGFDGSNNLSVKPESAGLGLDYCVASGFSFYCVRAENTGATGSEIRVQIDTGGTNVLMIDSDDVVSALGTPIINASNGLTKSGNYVTLGGALTGNTTIDGTGSFFDLTLTNIGDFNVEINAGSVITDNSSTGGLRYATDYSGDFVARSLPDVDYVTGLTSQGIVTANNGLTKEGQNVRLGGTLTGDTCVETGTNIVNGFGLTFGSNSCASGPNSVSFGYETCATSFGSFAMGLQTQSFGTGSFSSGRGTRACGDQSAAFGFYTCAVGCKTFAIGNATKAYGCHTFASGSGARACSGASAAFNSDTRALGYASFAANIATCAYGCGSFAIGYQTKAIGITSFAGGHGYGGGKEIIAQGRYSINLSTNTSAQIAGHGAIADSSAILGGRNHHIGYGHCRAAIIGGDGIKLTTGSSYEDHAVVDNLAIWSAPSTDNDGALLVWDSATKKVGQTSLSSLGGLTGASNGLSVSGQNAILGGALNQNTAVSGGQSYSMTFGVEGDEITEFRVEACDQVNIYSCVFCAGLTMGTNASLSSECNDVLITAGQDLLLTSSGKSICFLPNAWTVIDDKSKGLEYAADYSASGGTDPRWIPDAGWVTGSTLIDAANGLSTNGSGIVLLGGDLCTPTCINTNNVYNLQIGYNTSMGEGAIDNLAINRGASVGDYSEANFAANCGTIGDLVLFSTAFGTGSVTGGSENVVMGIDTKATGIGNLVLGSSSESKSSSCYSLAMGSQSITCAANSLAGGSCSVASGDSSFAFGESTLATAAYSVALGRGTEAVGVQGSMAIGYFTCAGGAGSFTGGIGTGSRSVYAGSGAFNWSLVTSGLGAGCGALANRSAILGGLNNNIAVGNTNAAIIGGNCIDLTGTTYIDYVAVNNLAIWDTPSTGDVDNDSVLLWDSTDKKVKQASVSAVGGITGASNGLSVSGKEVILGGTLTQNTSIDGDSGAYDLTLTSLDVFTASADVANILSPSGADQGFVSLTGTTTLIGQEISAIENKLEFNGGVITLTDGINSKGIVYAADYSSNFTARSLVDKGYVDGEIDKTITGASNGLTKTGQDVLLGGDLDQNTTVGLAGFGLVLGSGSSIANYVSVNNLAIEDTPEAGAITDSVLVWDSADKKVKAVSGAELGEDNNSYKYSGVTGNTTLVTGDTYLVLVDTSSSAPTITLPATPLDGQAFKIKDKSGNALANTITISGNGNNIDGSGSASINTDYGALELVYSLEDDEWFSLAFVN
jgi:hypothetical protein